MKRRLTVPRVESAIKTWFPGWAAARAKARVIAERYELAASSYRQLRASLQRRAHARKVRSEAAHASGELDYFREWSRETYRVNSFYSGVIRRSVDNWVGTGLRVVPKTGDRDLNRDLQQAFEAYCERDGGFDYERRFSFWERQRIVAISLLRDGDILAYRSDEGWQFFEGAQVATPLEKIRDNRFQSGIELDAAGRPQRFWVCPWGYGGAIDQSRGAGLRADRCCLIINPEWASGWRGMPALANALPRFEDLDGYLEAELFASRAASCIMGEFHSDDPSALNAVATTNLSSDQRTETSPRVLTFEPGAWVQTFGDEKITLHSASRPATAFGDFVRTMLRLCGAPIGMPLELAVFDLTDTNFAGARMILLQAWRTFRVLQEILATQFVIPVYRDWLSRQKEVKVPDDPQYRRVEVYKPRYQFIDPQKEAKAQDIALNAGVETITHIAADMQREVEDLLLERAHEIKLAKEIASKLGLEDWRDVLRNVGQWRVKK